MNQIEHFSLLLKSPLPGKEVQHRLSPVSGETHFYYQDAVTARQAGVMALLMPIDGEWHVVFIKRASHPKDKHSGQICFPGGGIEDKDSSLMACALRETQEEIGITIDKINVIGELTKLYVYASNNVVFPYVGYLNEQQVFEIEQKEVDKVITSPLSYLSDKTVLKTTSINIRGYQLKHVPYYDLHGEILWGATAMMMSEFLHVWNKIQ